MRIFLIILIFITLLVFIRLVFLRFKMKNPPPVLRPLYVEDEQGAGPPPSGPLEVREVYFSESPQSRFLEVTVEASRNGGRLRLFRLKAITPADFGELLRADAMPRFGKGYVVVADYDRDRIKRMIFERAAELPEVAEEIG